MGQIQNAILNSLGSVQQMIQMYKLTDTYVKQQTQKNAKAAKVAAKIEEQQKFEQAEEKRLRNRTAQQIEKDILSTPFTEEEEKKFAEKYKDLEDASPQKRGKPKGDLTNSINLYVGELTDSKYAELLREREWLRQKYPNKSEQQQAQSIADRKAKAQKSAQEQADTNGNIEKAKNTIKGGKK